MGNTVFLAGGITSQDMDRDSNFGRGTNDVSKQPVIPASPLHALLQKLVLWRSAGGVGDSAITFCTFAALHFSCGRAARVLHIVLHAMS